MFKDPKITPPPEPGGTPVEGPVAHHPPKPWEDRSLPLEERLESYKALVCERLEAIRAAFDRAGEAQDVATQKEIMNSPETKEWMDEGAWLQKASARDFFERIDHPRIIRELLRGNFLGAEAWKAQGIDVGVAPPIPETITAALLESDCPFHPSEKIKDTHLLVLVPSTVNGEPYSILKLEELCATKKISGNSLIREHPAGAILWRKELWASAPQVASEWVLMPKGDPDRSKTADEKHFRNKNISQQQKVHNAHYKEYREVKTVEIVTAMVLDYLANGKPWMLDMWESLRCLERNLNGGRVCVGTGHLSVLQIAPDVGNSRGHGLGRALARKS